MKYNLEKKNYKNFKVFKDNVKEPRAYFIPFKTLDGAKSADVRTERYTSDIVTVLSGLWDFKFYSRASKVPDKFDAGRVKFDEIKVPSDWQRTGYQEPVYLNCPYEFNTDPPLIPEDCPAGIYRKKFNLSGEGKTYILTFLGASSNIEVYLNGNYVGYSEGSHNTSEFDITENAVKGENELLVLSYKWCNGSFLEAQDMFRENGIFRDAYVSEYGSSYIYDYQVKTKKNGEYYDLECIADVPSYQKGSSVKISLYDGENEIFSLEKKASKKVKFDVENLKVVEWNAEEPYLYNLYITLFENGNETESIRNLTGFKTVEIKKNVFYFNGKNIKIKGVNHHDANPKTGYVMTAEDYENDLKLMKEFNVNAIRTSHYPPDPIMLILSDIYGFYVIDEADIETHGINEITGSMDTISSNSAWRHHYLDRVKRMYMRDRNRVSVTMWSLGNESGGYKCQDFCYDYLKSVCPEIPVHYEGVSATKRVAYDVCSEMYTKHEDLLKIGQCDGRYKGRYKNGSKISTIPYLEKPFFMCEYAHSMGQGPGALMDYWDIIYEYDNLLGGCIWEWCDHAVYHESDDKKYPYEYTYGGDHKEKRHDGNFCVDGLFYPDRTPHTGAFEMKEAYRPVTAEYGGQNTVKLTNTNRFKNASYLKIKWVLLKNGCFSDEGELSSDIEPMDTASYTLALDPMDNENDYALNIICLDGDREVSREQLILNDAPSGFKPIETGIISASTDGNVVTVKFIGGEARFSSESGSLISYKKDGTEYINQNPASGRKGFLPTVFRAPLDNDVNIKEKWEELKLDSAEITKDSFEVCLEGAGVSVMTVYNIKGGKKDLFCCIVYYLITPDGNIKVRAALNKVTDDETYIPRFGLTLEAPKEFCNIEYYGRGPKENLPDFKAHAPIGIYKSKVHDMHEPYIFPQSNGEHCDVKWIKISDDLGRAIKIYAEDKIAFSAHDYTEQSLYNAKHREEIVYADSSIINIDGYVRGTGTASCGPQTLSEYCIDEESMLIFEFYVSIE